MMEKIRKDFGCGASVETVNENCLLRSVAAVKINNSFTESGGGFGALGATVMDGEGNRLRSVELRFFVRHIDDIIYMLQQIKQRHAKATHRS